MSNEEKRKPVFKRVTDSDNTEEYNYAEHPLGKPGVEPANKAQGFQSPSVSPQESNKKVEQHREASSERQSQKEAKEVKQSEKRSEPEIQESGEMTEEQKKALAEAKEELRNTAREVARDKYVGSIPIDTLEKALMNPSLKGVKWGVIGSGQGGSRLAEQFHKFGYPACAINTAKQDLTFIDIPEENKLFMDFSLGGAGKDLAIGDAAIVEFQEDVLDLMRRVFDEQEVETIIVCAGGGGGTGSGSIPNLIKLVSRFGLPVIVLYTLPMTNEGALTKSNSIRALQKIANLSQQDIINALVIVDNAKIEQIYPHVAAGKFWQVANFDIVNTLNLFNTLCRCDTSYDSLDPMDFARIFSTGNCTIYGHIEVPVQIKDGQVEMFESELANTVLTNLHSGLLAEGFNLKETVAAGVIVTGRADILDQIPAVNIHFMQNELNRTLGDARVYHGLYKDENPNNSLSVYTIFSGLGLPYERVDGLLKEAEAAETVIEKKSADKSKMTLKTESTPIERDSTYDQMRQRNTAFGRLANKRGQRRRRG